MLKRMSCHRMASSSLCWPLRMSMPPMFTRGNASTRRVMLTTCRHMLASQHCLFRPGGNTCCSVHAHVTLHSVRLAEPLKYRERKTHGILEYRQISAKTEADLVAILDGLGLFHEGLEGRPVHGLPFHAAGRNCVKDPQQHVAVPQRLHQVLDVDLVVQQAQQPHPEGALLPRVLPKHKAHSARSRSPWMCCSQIYHMIPCAPKGRPRLSAEGCPNIAHPMKAMTATRAMRAITEGPRCRKQIYASLPICRKITWTSYSSSHCAN